MSVRIQTTQRFANARRAILLKDISIALALSGVVTTLATLVGA